VIAPPSVHPSGETYRWEASARINEVELPSIPVWLVGLIVKSESRTTNENNGSEALTGFDLLRALNGVREGERNDQIFRAACSFRGTNTVRKVAIQACLEAAAKCVPPFSSDETRKIVMRAYTRYRTDGRPGIEIQPGRRPWMVDRAEEVILD
jgi:hypothetical protein